MPIPVRDPEVLSSLYVQLSQCQLQVMIIITMTIMMIYSSIISQILLKHQSRETLSFSLATDQARVRESKDGKTKVIISSLVIWSSPFWSSGHHWTAIMLITSSFEGWGDYSQLQQLHRPHLGGGGGGERGGLQEERDQWKVQDGELT